MTELITDHKPLEIIYSPKSKPPLHIEKWALRLRPFDFQVKYKPGKTNAADAFSRLPLSDVGYLKLILQKNMSILLPNMQHQ